MSDEDEGNRKCFELSANETSINYESIKNQNSK